MKNIEKIIRERLGELRISQKELCEQIGFQPAALHKIFERNSTSIDTLEKISIILKLPISSFFEETKNTVNEPQAGYTSIKNEELIELQRIALEAKQKEVQSLKHSERVPISL
jgi:transcriptional regulator with XRE-family HTH domain